MGRRRLDERRRLRVERYLLTLRRHGHQPQLEDSTMTTDTEALICDCPAKNMPFGRCCKLEPLTALRAAFESTVSEWGWDTYRNRAGDYATTSTNGAWAGYQAGHAAAKAETAAAVATEREHCALVCEDVRRAVAEINGAGVAAAQQCADAIRAGAKEPSDG